MSTAVMVHERAQQTGKRYLASRVLQFYASSSLCPARGSMTHLPSIELHHEHSAHASARTLTRVCVGQEGIIYLKRIHLPKTNSFT